MTFEDKIESVVNSMTVPPSFIGGDWFKLNYLLDGTTLPAAMWINPVNGMFEIKTQVLDQPYCFIAFADKVVFDETHEDTTEVSGRMKALAIEFILRLNASGLFHPVYDPKYEIFYDRADTNVYALCLIADIKERQGATICLPDTSKRPSLIAAITDTLSNYGFLVFSKLIDPDTIVLEDIEFCVDDDHLNPVSVVVNGSCLVCDISASDYAGKTITVNIHTGNIQSTDGGILQEVTGSPVTNNVDET